MSILKKNALAVALVAGLGIAGTAGAYVTHTNDDLVPEKVATADAADDSVTMTEEVQVNVNSTDLIVGRTGGFQVRVNLFGGSSGSDAQFETTPTLGAGADLPAGWGVSVVAGGAGFNYMVVSVAPPSTTPVPGITPGELFTFMPTLTNVEELLAEGGVISGQTFFADPGTTTELPSSRVDVKFLQSGNPVVMACDATDGDVTKRIDVADTSDGMFGHEAKTAFSPDGTLGGSAIPSDEAYVFDFGDVSASVDTAFSSFTYLPGDHFHLVMTGDGSFGAFDSIYLSEDNCATPMTSGGGVIGGTGNNTVTFDFDADDVSGGSSSTGATLQVCGEVSGSDVIDDVSSISVTGTFTRGTSLTHTQTCSLLPLQYNGTVIEVYYINPARNPNTETFIRVINRSDTGGIVRLEGIDDQGHDAPGGEVSFYLGAGESMHVNSNDLEHGNSGKGLTGMWGDGHGKWRAIVTAEFVGARVQSMSRNTTDNTITNLTDSDGQGEQIINGLLDNGIPSYLTP